MCAIQSSLMFCIQSNKKKCDEYENTEVFIYTNLYEMIEVFEIFEEEEEDEYENIEELYYFRRG